MNLCLKKIWINGFHLFCVLILAAVFVTEVKASGELNLSDIVTVWSGGDDGQSAILLSQKIDEQWSEPFVLSVSDELNITPSIAVDEKNGDAVVVWSSFYKGQISLFMKQYVDGEWLESQEIVTGMDVNVAPSVVYDDEGAIWSVWVSSDGEGDDIYYSRWNGTTFEPAERITDNSVPDLSPVLGKTAEGMVWVQWKRYSSSGFITQVASWNGESWELQNNITDDVFLLHYPTQNKENDVEAEEILLDLPEYVTDPDMASVFLPEQEIQSIPIKFIRK